MLYTVYKTSDNFNHMTHTNAIPNPYIVENPVVMCEDIKYGNQKTTTFFCFKSNTSYLVMSMSWVIIKKSLIHDSCEFYHKHKTLCERKIFQRSCLVHN